MITIDSPITGKRESLTQPEFNSYMAQTNGAVLKWIVSPVLKHQEHDQSTHGNWALSENFPDLLTLGAFDEETKYDPALMVYSERYGVDKEGNIVGVEKYEHDAIDTYSQSGYININEYLRGSGGVRDEIGRAHV